MCNNGRHRFVDYDRASSRFLSESRQVAADLIAVVGAITAFLRTDLRRFPSKSLPHDFGETLGTCQVSSDQSLLEKALIESVNGDTTFPR